MCIRDSFNKAPADVVAGGVRTAVCDIGAAVDDDVAGAKLGHRGRVSVEDFEVAVFRGQFDRRGRVLEERALGSDEPYADLVCLVCHEGSFQSPVNSGQWSANSKYR